LLAKLPYYEPFATEKVADSIKSLPNSPQARRVVGNLSNTDASNKVMDSVKELFRIDGKDIKIDILVKGLGDITPEDFSKVYDLNVRGALLMTQALLPYLPPKEGLSLLVHAPASQILVFTTRPRPLWKD